MKLQKETFFAKYSAFAVSTLSPLSSSPSHWIFALIYSRGSANCISHTLARGFKAEFALNSICMCFPKLLTGRSLLAIYDGGRATWWAGGGGDSQASTCTVCAPAGVNIQRGCVMWSHHHLLNFHHLKPDNKNRVLSFYILEWTDLTQWICPSLLVDLIIPKFSLLLAVRILIFFIDIMIANESKILYW